MKFILNLAEDDSVDSELALVHADGSPTHISIQDCRSYGGGYAVNRYEPDMSGVTFLKQTRSLAEAKKAAVAAVLS